MKVPMILALLLEAARVCANMASPILEESWTATPFVSRYVEIVREKIQVIPDASFEAARFEIEYHIRAEKSGNQIPLLFYASDFKEGFQIWVDGQPVQLETISDRYEQLQAVTTGTFLWSYCSTLFLCLSTGYLCG